MKQRERHKRVKPDKREERRVLPACKSVLKALLLAA
jgi:hypothetical protein